MIKDYWRSRGTERLEPTQGEAALASAGTEKWLENQEITDARRLIETGNRNNDPETVKIGQARLRVAIGQPTLEDLEILGL